MIDAKAIVGGTVIDVKTGQATSNVTVVIRGGRISDIRPADGVELPPEVERIDASQAWLVPGLADMHVHVRTPALLPLYLAYGVTTIRDLGGNLARSELLRRDLASGRRIGPRLFFVGPILDGVPPLWPDTTILVDTAPRAEAAVRFLAAHSVDYLKVYNSVPETSLVTIVRTAHEVGLRVTGHVPRAMTMTQAIEIGMDGLEHIRITGREMLPADEAAVLDFLPARRRETLLWERYDLAWPQFERIVERLAQARTFLDPTFVVDAAPLRTSEERERAEDMSDIPSWIAEIFRRAAAVRATTEVRGVSDVPEELMESARDGLRKRQRFIGMCAAAGVRLISGTDHAGPGEDLPGRGIQRELRYLVECGLTPVEALRASTVNAAAALGRETELGTIEPGKLADILVLNRDPLEDIRNISAIRTVVHGGTARTPATLLAAQPEEPESAYAR